MTFYGRYQGKRKEARKTTLASESEAEQRVQEEIAQAAGYAADSNRLRELRRKRCRFQPTHQDTRQMDRL